MKKLGSRSALALFASMGVLLVGCGGEDGATGPKGSAGPPGSTSLISTSDASTTDCPGGGVVVNNGVDDDGDGLLGEDEIDGTQIICGNAAAGSLVETVVLEEGDANCEFGGVEVRTGTDDNGNGTLDDGEFSSSFVCAGAPGADGDNGTNGTNGAKGA
ncbi:MAG TPA: hypothetical protein VF103_02810, partial [Polyangiaceae bacterium]